VLIDDAAVKITARSAKLYSSQLQNILVNVWPEPDWGLMLSVKADIAGEAGDGLQFIQESPLKSNIGETFADWNLQGELSTKLNFSMSLSGAKNPQVNVATNWHDVNIDIASLRGTQLQYS